MFGDPFLKQGIFKAWRHQRSCPDGEGLIGRAYFTIYVERSTLIGRPAPMIRTFKDKDTKAVFAREFVKRFSGIEKSA